MSEAKPKKRRLTKVDFDVILDALQHAEAHLFEMSEAGSLGAKLAIDNVQQVLTCYRPKATEKRAPIMELIAKPGLMEMKAKMPHWAMSVFLKSFGDSLGDAPNYVEAQYEMDMKDYVVTIRRRHGKTPNQLRTEAEERVKALEAELAELKVAQ